jgi:hypothetical protein
LGLPFFGLTQEYRTYLFSQIHEIVFHGKGGYDWETVYNMPIWLRNYTFKKMEKFYKEEKEAEEKFLASSQGKQTLENDFTSIQRPDIKAPNYSTKASKK